MDYLLKKEFYIYLDLDDPTPEVARGAESNFESSIDEFDMLAQSRNPVKPTAGYKLFDNLKCIILLYNLLIKYNWKLTSDEIIWVSMHSDKL